ncbi:MAG: hypothetical protein R8G66_01675 [Cytophagales bacterium]|nr:hypothetical protein [Cytophagales bacterium]
MQSVRKNLYAGPSSAAAISYEVQGYPTKIIVGRDKEIQDFEFDKAMELVGLLE